MLQRAAAVATIVLVSACEVPADSPAFPGTPLAADDARIAATLYAGTPRTPPQFRSDDTPLGFAHVTTFHVKSQQLAPSLASYELCTDDWNEAFDWSEQVAAQSAELLDYVVSTTTDRYFEFDRMPRTNLHHYVRMRVFRCSYLDRTATDATGAGFAGVLNARPIDASTLRELSEYLWFFTPYNDADHAVLASQPRPADGFAHALTIASLERAASDACDRVVVRDWTHTVHAETGVLELAITAARDFFVRREGDVLVACRR
jgi:hypothetical protein